MLQMDWQAQHTSHNSGQKDRFLTSNKNWGQNGASSFPSQEPTAYQLYVQPLYFKHLYPMIFKGHKSF